jgi:hypothetical protein
MEQPRGIVEDRTLGWGALLNGGLEIQDTPGHHGAIVREPRSRVLATQLNKALQKAQWPPDQVTIGITTSKPKADIGSIALCRRRLSESKHCIGVLQD